MADNKNDKNDTTEPVVNDTNDDHTAEQGYPVVEVVPAPGQDPDTLRRNEKHAVAASGDADNRPQSGYPYDTDSDKLKDAGMPDRDNAGNPNPHADDDDTDGKGDAAKARKAGSTTRTTAPQGRSATPTQKAAG